MPIQNMVPGFEITTFGTWVSSHDHKTITSALMCNNVWWSIKTFQINFPESDRCRQARVDGNSPRPERRPSEQQPHQREEPPRLDRPWQGGGRAGGHRPHGRRWGECLPFGGFRHLWKNNHQTDGKYSWVFFGGKIQIDFTRFLFKIFKNIFLGICQHWFAFSQLLFHQQLVQSSIKNYSIYLI